MALSRICRCDICTVEELTRQSILPEGWIITWEEAATICSECADLWRQRFGEEPAYYFKEGTAEIEL